MHRALTSSDKQDWATPRLFPRAAAQELGLPPPDLDVCAWPWTAVCRRYYRPPWAYPAGPIPLWQEYHSDGLSQPWDGHVCWLYPPYAEQGPWIGRAVTAASRAHHVVALIPARTDTALWHELVLPTARRILLVRGRLRFRGLEPRPRGGRYMSAPFPAAVIHWDGQPASDWERLVRPWAPPAVVRGWNSTRLR